MSEHKKHRSRRHSRRVKSPGGPSISTLQKLVVEEIEVAAVGDTGELQQQRTSRSLTMRQALPGVRLAIGLAGLWILLVGAALLFRSPWATDETRVLAVSWELWLHHNWLVPSLNGEPYIQSPPLMFWLVKIGWIVTGVNDWWPRLISPLFGLLSLGLASALARLLWPGQPLITRYAPAVLFGFPFWALFATVTSQDMVLTCFTLLALCALPMMWRRPGLLSWLLLGIGLGLGALTAGFTIYIYVLPAAILAPVWIDKEPEVSAGYWYGGVIKAIIVSGAIFAGWFVPYVEGWSLHDAMQLLLGFLPPQTMDAFASNRPWWWYLALAPVVFLPWVVWPLPWMRLWLIRQEPMSSGLRFCLVWLLVSLVILSLLPVRQPQMLLPLVPGMALMMAYLLFDDDLIDYALERAVAGMSIPIIVIGGVLAFLPGLPRIDVFPEFLWTMSPLIGVALAAVGIGLSWLPDAGLRLRTMNIVTTGILLVVFSIFFFGWRYNDRFAVPKVADFIARAYSQNRPVAHVGPYQGQFQLAAHLTSPLPVLSAHDVSSWAAGNRDGFVVTYLDGWQPRPASDDEPVLVVPYKDTKIVVWKAWFLGRAY